MIDTFEGTQNPIVDPNLNKLFWEELIAYFPLIRHVPYRKRLVQQLFYCYIVFVVVVTFLPSSCLTTIVGHTYRHTD
jgi:hypothetical protein